MSYLRVAVRCILGLLIVAGLWSSLRLSFLTVTGKAPCPDVLGVPLCYLVALGYLSMFASQIPSLGRLKSWLFNPAWTLVFLIAISGTGIEVVVGDACPITDGGVPMCYISLAFCTVIFLLYWLDFQWPKLSGKK
jgi:hypothetical protein